MKIDLHCHTIEAKEGDKGRGIDAEDLARTLADNHVSIAAITNHNLFDLDKYRECVQAADSRGIAIWPGIEFDIRGKSHAVGHVIVIADPDKAESFSEICNELIEGKHPDSFVLDWQDLAPTFVKGGFDFLVLSHYWPKEGGTFKDKALPYEDNEALRAQFPEETPFFFEPSNLKRAGVMYADGISCLIGSDVKDWTKYSECSLPELKLEIDDFRQFLLLLRKTPEVLKTVMDKKSAETIDIALFDDAKSFPISIYNDVNIVFGAKGVGKTGLLRKLEEHFLSKGWTDVSTYYASDNNDKYKQMVTVKPQEDDFDKLAMDDSADDLAFLKQWSDVAVTPFIKYVTWGKYETERRDTEKFGFSLATAPAEPDLSSMRSFASRYQELLSNARSLLNNELVNGSLSNDELLALHALVTKACNNARLSFRTAFINAHALRLEAFTIKKMKGYITARTGQPTKPASTGFSALAAKHRETRRVLKSIRDKFESEPVEETTTLGRLVEKGDVVQRRTYVINPSHATGVSYLRDGVSATNLKHLVSLIKEASEQSKVPASQLSAKIVEVNKQADLMGISSLRDCLGVSSSVECGNDAKYEPSSGEKAMIVLARALFDDTASIYILDEPESSMGNEFINSVIVDRINNLAKENKTVIVSTHNANIAVRTLPWQSIYREYADGRYVTYTGNPFCDELKDVESIAECKNWTAMSVKTLEGGEDAFTDRELVYGKLN